MKFDYPLLLVLFLSACATLGDPFAATISDREAQATWIEVQRDFDIPAAPMPAIAWTDTNIRCKDSHGVTSWCYGAFLPNRGPGGTVILRRNWAGRGTLRHEFEHAVYRYDHKKGRPYEDGDGAHLVQRRYP